LRILFVTPHYWPEPFRSTDVAAGLRARGHHVGVLTCVPNYPAGRFYDGYGYLGPYREEHEGVSVTRAAVVPRGAGGALRLVCNYASFAFTAALHALRLGRQRWDVVFIFETSPVTVIFPAILIRALHRTPVAVWVQDLWPESIAATGFGRSRSLYAVARFISSWLYRRCDRVIGTSRAFLHRLVALGVAAERFSYLPQWAEEFFAAAGDEARLPGGRWAEGFPVVFAGNLGRVQALDTILDAAELLRDDEAVRWVFIGDGSRREWLESEVRRRKLEDRVFLLGRHPPHTMPAFFARAGAMLVSLRRDEAMALTVPAKIQAYLAAGRPVIASMDGEGARIIEEAGAGLVAPAGDAAALADVVRRMKELPASERAAMGAHGRDYSERNFARERCLDELERVLRDVVAEAKPAGAVAAQ
jgi:glycosyltransferase involved in cell wall biosynthesis